MGSIADKFGAAFRDYNTDGVPASGAHKPVKHEIQALGAAIEQAAGSAALGSVSVVKSSLSALNADLAHPDGATALVYADPTTTNNDIFIKVGATGTGSWTNTGILHLVSGAAAASAADAAESADEAEAARDQVRPLFGTVAPTTQGSDGQVYYQISGGIVTFYGPKAAGAWPAGVPLNGLQGNPGAAATVAVSSTTTLSPGSPATVTNIGTSAAAQFVFGIPQGATGATGAGLSFVQGPWSYALTDSNGYRWFYLTLTDLKHPAVDLIRTRITGLESYAAKQPLASVQGPASWSLTDSNGYNWLRATPTTLQHQVIDAHSRNIHAALRGAPDATLADMRNIAERIGLHMSGESLSLGHASTPPISSTASTYSDMFGNSGLTLASVVPDDISDIASSTDPNLVANRAALTAAFEITKTVDADDWTSHGESPMSGCAQMIVQLLKDEDGIDFLASGMKFLLADDGRNGSGISAEMDNASTLTYARVYASMSQAEALYAAASKNYMPAAQMLMIGTNDNYNDATNYPTPTAKYFYNLAVTLQAQRQTKARQIAGGTFRLPLLLGQVATHTIPAQNLARPNIALDQVQLAIDHQEFILALIQYGVENLSGDPHLSNKGSKHAGAYFGAALKRLLFDGIRTAPMIPTFHAQGSQIIATFPIRPGHKIAGGITASDTTVLSNWGVQAVDSGGVAKTLSNPRVVARDRVVWDAPAAPANTWMFRCGWAGNTTKGWTNIGETRADATVIFDPFYLRLPMYRWLPICEVPLT